MAATRGVGRALANAGLSLASCILFAGLMEGVIRIGGGFALQREAATAGGDSRAEPQSPVGQSDLHPFLGWSRRPGSIRSGDSNQLRSIFGAREPTAWWRRHSRTNALGFHSPLVDYRTLTASQFVVGIFGGSVADNLCSIGGEALRDRILRERPELLERLVILNLGSGGYKQPQQVGVLAELVLLGVPLDVVVNVDGFNEVALGGADAEAGFHPLFPSRQHHRAVVDLSRGAPSPDTILLTAEILERQGAVERIRRRFTASSWLSRFELAKAIGGALVLRHEALAAAAEHELQTLAAFSVGDNPMAALDDPCLGSAADCWDLIADLWERSSVLMSGISRAIGARYIHVLQPNQYVEGGKRLSEVERQIAFRPEDRWSRMARDGYPHLRRRGRELRRQGVEFYDLTQIFADQDRTLYRDTCCHLNLEGNEWLAEAVGGLVGSER